MVDFSAHGEGDFESRDRAVGSRLLIAGYVHLKAIDFVDRVNAADGREAALKEIAAVCDGIPQDLV
jgi:hypothetical protein